MTFKNKKEEVIEIELTSFGKHLLSNGKFQPTYYSFFDDDVLYDAAFAGSPEEQNYSQVRILEETPVMRTQVHYTGAETEIERQIEWSRSDGTSLKESFQPTRERSYAMSTPLGRSSYSSEYFPSWDITIYGAKFSQVSSVKADPAHQTLRIPQLLTEDLEFKTSVVDEVIGTPIGDPETGHAEEVENYQVSYENGNYIQISHKNIVIEVDELHTDSLFENYDVEFFLVEGEQPEAETLIPLVFTKDAGSNVVNGILRDPQEEPATMELDNTFAEYYLNIDIDSEIEKATLCELGYRTDYSKRGHIRVECEDTNSESKMSEIYESDTPIEPFGDDC